MVDTYIPCRCKGGKTHMNNINHERFNRKRRWYRFKFGIQQMFYNPFINIIWVIFIIGAILLQQIMMKIVDNYNGPYILGKIFVWSIVTLLVLFLFVIAVSLCQLVGYLYAKNDEADMSLVFSENKDNMNYPPILISKRKDKASGVIIREFYTSISMKQWRDNKEAICDRMNVHIIGDFNYGGKCNNTGNRILFSSLKGRFQEDRGALYDEQF